MGAVGLEPTETEVEGFTVPCNCRYATPPIRKLENCWRKELNPQPSDYKSGALPIELRQHTKVPSYHKRFVSPKSLFFPGSRALFYGKPELL